MGVRFGLRRRSPLYRPLWHVCSPVDEGHIDLTSTTVADGAPGSLQLFTAGGAGKLTQHRGCNRSGRSTPLRRGVVGGRWRSHTYGSGHVRSRALRGRSRAGLTAAVPCAARGRGWLQVRSKTPIGAQAFRLDVRQRYNCCPIRPRTPRGLRSLGNSMPRLATRTDDSHAAPQHGPSTIAR